MSSALQRETPATESKEYFLSLEQCNMGFIYLIPVLIGAVQVCVQGINKSPLETHPANFYTFLLATAIYCFALTTGTKCKIHHTTNLPDQRNCSQISEVIAFMSGSLSAVSLISIIVPHWFGYMIFVSWGFVSGFVVYAHATLVKETFSLLLRKTENTWLNKKFCDNISSLYGAIRSFFQADSTLRPEGV